MEITRKQKWEEKQLCGCFKQLTSDISHEKMWMWLRKGNFKRETESLLIAPLNNVIRTSHIKTRIDKMQQNSRCRLCGDRDEMINQCCKLAQKDYKTRHQWVGKVIHWELCKKLKFDHTNKLYMCNPASFLEKETHKTLLGVWLINGSPNLDRMTRPCNNKKKKTCKIMDFIVPVDHRVKLKESEKKDKYLDLAWELKTV